MDLKGTELPREQGGGPRICGNRVVKSMGYGGRRPGSPTDQLESWANYLIIQNFRFLTHNMGVIPVTAFVGSKQVKVCEVLIALVGTKECLNNYFHFY